jgi:hypothetical protein
MNAAFFSTFQKRCRKREILSERQRLTELCDVIAGNFFDEVPHGRDTCLRWARRGVELTRLAVHLPAAARVFYVSRGTVLGAPLCLASSSFLTAYRFLMPLAKEQREAWLLPCERRSKPIGGSGSAGAAGYAADSDS